MQGFKDDEIACPYYKKEIEREIYCEGVDECVSLHVAFISRKSLTKYKHDRCRKCWKNCRIAKMLNEKWGYEP